MNHVKVSVSKWSTCSHYELKHNITIFWPLKHGQGVAATVYAATWPALIHQKHNLKTFHNLQKLPFYIYSTVGLKKIRTPLT